MYYFINVRELENDPGTELNAVALSKDFLLDSDFIYVDTIC